MFYFLVLQFYLKNGQKKKRKWHLSSEKAEEKKNSAITTIDGKGTVFPMKL